MPQPWQPYRESLASTLLRTGTIAAVIGLILALSRGGLARWPTATLLALWPSFGGHWIEIAYLNWLRPRLPSGRSVQLPARVAIWFFGGIVLTLGMEQTAANLPGFHQLQNIPWWIGGLGFIGVELIAHLALQLRHKPSFYNGRG